MFEFNLIKMKQIFYDFSFFIAFLRKLTFTRYIIKQFVFVHFSSKYCYMKIVLLSYNDFRRSRGAAVRAIGTLRTTQYDQNWLNEPQFVGSFEDDRFVYFVFREVAVEFMNCGKVSLGQLRFIKKKN